MLLITLTMAGLWVCGTALVAMTGFAVAVRELLLKRGPLFGRLALSLAAVGAGTAAGMANPIINMAAFKAKAEQYRTAMVEDAKSAGCVGQTTGWLQKRYGSPREVRREGAVQHWRYTPGPWFIVHGDSVGFTVVNSVVTGADVQVN